MESLERGLVLAKQVLNLLRSHLSHGLWVEYTALLFPISWPTDGLRIVHSVGFVGFLV